VPLRFFRGQNPVEANRRKMQVYGRLRDNVSTGAGARRDGRNRKAWPNKTDPKRGSA